MTQQATTDQTQMGGAKRLETLRIWMKSFIPREIEGAQPVPQGDHAGETMFKAPGPINAWFLTDGRAFSADPTAKCRMHSEIQLDVAMFKILGQLHYGDDTVQVDPQTGEEVCREKPDPSRMNFDRFELTPDTRAMKMHLHGSSQNACLKIGPVKISPHLDYDGTLTVQLLDDCRARVSFDGEIETYPAFEIYVSANDGLPVALFHEGVRIANPAILVGAASVKINHQVVVSC